MEGVEGCAFRTQDVVYRSPNVLIALASLTGTRNAILAEPARTAVHDNVGIDVPTI